MSSATATTNANIAVVKYWGKADKALNLPGAPSVSVTLDALTTTTSVTFDPELESDRVVLGGEKADKKTAARVSIFLDLVRSIGDVETYARVETENNFPTAAGLASSASGFAALTLAATSAADLQLTKPELSRLARQGSGSAARSIHGGFVKMNDGPDAFAEQIATSKHWDLQCLICLTDLGPKKIGSTVAMERTRETSPFYDAWLNVARRDTPLAVDAIRARDFSTLATIAERSCLRMHACAMAADPGIVYWRPETVALMHEVRSLRDTVPCFFTIDAGPHVKVFCETKDVDDVKKRLSAPGLATEIIVSGVAADPVVEKK